ncbi:hypothetical protein ACFQNE_14070 [Gordonia phosphorivorans]|uniref:Uncharacterized protein n=1 Tax=Gordonia phosphorivorans TaxID=1056982 RepID=A0ABV6H7I5_9ACTN
MSNRNSLRRTTSALPPAERRAFLRDLLHELWKVGGPLIAVVLVVAGVVVAIGAIVLGHPLTAMLALMVAACALWSGFTAP